MSEMARRRLGRLEALFAAAKELPDPQREAYVRGQCADDAGLAAEVLELLALDAGSNTLLDHSADPWIGHTFERWRVVRRLGAGGMGIVYLAERSDGAFRQPAALKVLKHGLESADLVERFRQERQILAGLSHPAIARLIDGGATSEGVPWLVMELVVGTRLDLWCDERRWTLPQRLELFRSICAAVHYAHQSLVVHGDIKPSNILVTPDGAAKLVDFGISKVIEATSAEPALRSVERRLTPEYAPPEVIRGENAGTASDVFSLGVLLHELLTGRRPWHLVEGDVTALERAILERRPPPPSEVAPSREAAEARGLSSAGLRRALCGDLDAIVARAIASEPRERYSSAQSLAADVGRTLAHLPVLAREPTPLYVATRFVRRHRSLSLAAALGIAALAAGVFGVIASARSAQRHAEATQRVNTLLTDMLMQVDPASARGFSRSLLNQLQAADRRLDAGLLADDPESERDLRAVLGRTYHVLGYGEPASEQFATALALARETLGPRSLRVARLMRFMGAAERNAGRAAQASVTLDSAVTLARELAGVEPGRARAARDELVDALHEQGLTLQLLGRSDSAETALREALELRAELDGLENESIAGLQNALASALLARGDPGAAEPLARAAYELRGRIHPDVDPRRAWSDETLTHVLLALGRADEALPLAEHCLELRRELFDPLSPPLAVALMLRGDVRSALGRSAEAADDYLDALAIRRGRTRDEAVLELTLLTCGLALFEAGDAGRAWPLLEEALAIGAPASAQLDGLRARARELLGR